MLHNGRNTKTGSSIGRKDITAINTAKEANIDIIKILPKLLSVRICELFGRNIWHNIDIKK